MTANAHLSMGKNGKRKEWRKPENSNNAGAGWKQLTRQTAEEKERKKNKKSIATYQTTMQNKTESSIGKIKYTVVFRS